MASRDPYLDQLIGEADRYVAQRDYTRALEILDKADKDFPHQRDVLARREACLKRLGRKTFAVGPEQKERVAFKDIAEAVVWDREDIVERDEGPVRKISRKTETALPSMVDPLEIQPEPPAPYVFEQKKPNQLLPLALLLLYFGGTLIYATRGPAPGDVDRFLGVPFVWVPAASEAEIRALGVDPESSDGLRRGFWMAQTELTVADWERLVYGRAVEDEQLASLPKSGVSFVDAELLAKAMSRMEAGLFRIPTEAEWRWAYLAGDRAPRTMSKEQLDQVAWYGHTSGDELKPIGERAPNAWNLYDMLGNLEEWVDTTPPPDEPVPIPDRYRLLKGGSYLSLESIVDDEAYSIQEMTIPASTAGVRLVREDRGRSAGARRVLRFPNNPVGLLQINGQRAGDAVGDIAVLEDDQVTLNILANHPHDLSGLNLLAASDLHGLRISHPDVQAEDLARLSHLTGLVELDLSQTPVAGSALNFLIKYDALQSVYLDQTGIMGDALQPLLDITTLRHLSLRDNPQLDSSAAPRLQAFDQLVELDLTNTGLTPRDMTDIQLEIPLCRVIPEATEFTLAERLHRASLGGEYKLLLHQIKPSAAPSRAFVLDGFQDRASFGAHENLTPGYWVYVAPYWYVWKYRGHAPQPNVQPWLAVNAVGEPAPEPPPDGTSTWTPGAGTSPWLLVQFPDYIEPAEVQLYWTSAPHPIQSVVVYSETGDPVTFADPRQQAHTEWTHHTLQHLDATPQFALEHEGLATNRVRITFQPVQADAAEPPEFALDAVQLRGRFGREQWAQIAAASSEYEDQSAATVEADDETPHRPWTPVEVNPPRLRGLPGLIESLFTDDPAGKAKSAPQ